MWNLIQFIVSFLLRFLSEKRTIEIFLALAEKFVQSTENDVDDMLLAEIKKKLLKIEEPKLGDAIKEE